MQLKEKKLWCYKNNLSKVAKNKVSVASQSDHCLALGTAALPGPPSSELLHTVNDPARSSCGQALMQAIPPHHPAVNPALAARRARFQVQVVASPTTPLRASSFPSLPFFLFFICISVFIEKSLPSGMPCCTCGPFTGIQIIKHKKENERTINPVRTVSFWCVW